MEPTETMIQFPKGKPASNVGDQPAELKKENIKVEAGEFECYFVEVAGTKSWSSIKFPGLLVKMEGANTSMELVEWKE
jgi:hypothetical protein